MIQPEFQKLSNKLLQFNSNNNQIWKVGMTEQPQKKFDKKVENRVDFKRMTQSWKWGDSKEVTDGSNFLKELDRKFHIRTEGNNNKEESVCQ